MFIYIYVHWKDIYMGINGLILSMNIILITDKRMDFLYPGNTVN